MASSARFSRAPGFELGCTPRGEARIKFCPDYAYIVYAQLADVVTRLRQSGKKCVDLAGRQWPSIRPESYRLCDSQAAGISRISGTGNRNPDHCDAAAGDLVDIVDESLGFLHHDNHRT